MVDPIDGTVAFLKSRPHFTICAAVVVDGRAVLAGAIYNPMLDRSLLGALRRRRACRNGTPIHVSALSRPERTAPCWAIAPCSAAPPWPQLQVREPATRSPIGVMLVADGSADATRQPHRQARLGPGAPPTSSCTRPAACLTDACGTTLRYNGDSTIQPSLVAANPALHAEIIALLRQ